MRPADFRELLFWAPICWLFCVAFHYWLTHAPERPQWNTQEEHAEESRRFASYKNRDITHADPTWLDEHEEGFVA